LPFKTPRPASAAAGGGPNAGDTPQAARPVEPVALRPVLPAQRAPATWSFTAGLRPIPSPDAALGDGHGRSATLATTVRAGV